MPDGRSPIRPEEDPQGLLDEFAGTRERDGPKEYIDTGRVIGTWRSNKTGETAATTRITIRFGRNGGAHVFPAPPRNIREGG
jgi:hypothetical protein